MAIFTFWLPYMAPFLVAWYRVRKGKPIVTTLPLIFMMNLMAGWTGIVWVLLMAEAFNYNPVAWFVLRLAPYLPKGPGTVGGSVGGGAAAGPGACGQCGGAGTLSCSSCQGRGQWYEGPTTAEGAAQLRTCAACVSSGRLRCTYCGGSGRSA